MISLIRAVVLFMVLSFGTVFAAAPTISTPKVTGISGGTAKLTAKVNPNASATTVTFSYGHGMTINYTATATGTPALAAGDPETLVTTTISGLIPGDTYQFKVDATNGGATTSTNQTFVQTTDSPTLTINAPPTHLGGTATVHGTVTTAGVSGQVYFDYGANATPPPAHMMTTPEPVAANTTFSTDKDLTPSGATYHYRFVFVADLPSTITVSTPDAVNNRPPQAVADSALVSGSEPVTIGVLANDSDPDTGDTLTIVSVTNPKHGTAAISGGKVKYTPGSTLRDFDQFSYTIKDNFGATATATVTIRTLRSSLAGTHGGIVLNYKGKAAGYFQLTATATGAFTGTAIIDGKRYALGGAFSPTGSYVGSAVRGGKSIPLVLGTLPTATGTVLNANFAAGGYTSQVTFDQSGTATPGTFAGRYNMEISSGGGSSGSTTTTTSTTNNALPGGTGWASIQVYYDGTAKIDARLSDNRGFVTSGVISVVGSAATLTFFDTLERTIIAANLTLGDSVSGTVEVDRDKSDDPRFPLGYHIIESVSGSRYVQPIKGKRVLDSETIKGDELTISFSGSDLPGTLSRELSLDQDDGVTVLDSGREKLDVSIDRHSGEFEANVTIDAGGTRLRGRGVLIQGAGQTGSGRGVGVFTTANQTGIIGITVIGSSGPTSPTPVPTPTPTPTPKPTPAPLP